MSKICTSMLGLTITLSSWLFSPVWATPLIALREAQNCGACHTPGRSQRPVLERRCTLDCQGCHADPGGGGARNQWGYYYSIDQASMVSPYKPIDPLKDTSRFDIHADTRSLLWINSEGRQVNFPMVMESTVRVRPFIRYLNISYSALLLGRPDDAIFRRGKDGSRRFREKYSVMLDNLPLNTYVRGYRGTPMYGIKRPNHTLWIRERIGLDPFSTTDAYEVGGTPNVPFFRASQMLGDPYVEVPLRQQGRSYHGGMRGVSFGWNVNTSGWSTQSDYHKIEMSALGGGMSFFNIALYGERNWRHVSNSGLVTPDTLLGVQPSSTIGEYTLAFQGIRGLALGVVKEELSTLGSQGKRDSFFIDVHPIPWLQFEIWRRRERFLETAEDTLGVLHLYADF